MRVIVCLKLWALVLGAIWTAACKADEPMPVAWSCVKQLASDPSTVGAACACGNACPCKAAAQVPAVGIPFLGDPLLGDYCPECAKFAAEEARRAAVQQSQQNPQEQMPLAAPMGSTMAGGSIGITIGRHSVSFGYQRPRLLPMIRKKE